MFSRLQDLKIWAMESPTRQALLRVSSGFRRAVKSLQEIVIYRSVAPSTGIHGQYQTVTHSPIFKYHDVFVQRTKPGRHLVCCQLEVAREAGGPGEGTR